MRTTHAGSFKELLWYPDSPLLAKLRGTRMRRLLARTIDYCSSMTILHSPRCLLPRRDKAHAMPGFEITPVLLLRNANRRIEKDMVYFNCCNHIYTTHLDNLNQTAIAEEVDKSVPCMWEIALNCFSPHHLRPSCL